MRIMIQYCFFLKRVSNPSALEDIKPHDNTDYTHVTEKKAHRRDIQNTTRTC